MRNHDGPAHEPAPWSALPPDRAAGDAYLDQATRPGAPAGAARSAGLRRLSRLTWRATQLGALATVGFATLFARTAPAATVTSPPHPTPSVTASHPSASPSPSPSPARTHRRRPHHHHHHRVPPGAAPSAAAPSSAAPSPTLAPPTTPPAPPPPNPKPSPKPSPHTSSSPSHHGGG